MVCIEILVFGIKGHLYIYILTLIFAAVLGSRKDLTVFHNILNPEPALMINMRFKVYKEASYSVDIQSFLKDQRDYEIDKM